MERRKILTDFLNRKAGLRYIPIYFIYLRSSVFLGESGNLPVKN
jgi:hypothetical protein